MECPHIGVLPVSTTTRARKQPLEENRAHLDDAPLGMQRCQHITRIQSTIEGVGRHLHDAEVALAKGKCRHRGLDSLRGIHGHSRTLREPVGHAFTENVHCRKSHPLTHSIPVVQHHRIKTRYLQLLETENHLCGHVSRRGYLRRNPEVIRIGGNPSLGVAVGESCIDCAHAASIRLLDNRAHVIIGNTTAGIGDPVVGAPLGGSQHQVRHGAIVARCLGTVRSCPSAALRLHSSGLRGDPSEEL